MAKHKFQVLGGDWKRGAGSYNAGWFSSLIWLPGAWRGRYPSEVEEVAVVGSDTRGRGPTKAGAGAAGFLLGGPIGAAIGVLVGGQQQERVVTWTMRFRCGKQFTAQSSPETYAAVAALAR